ncbi:hypothetical protein BD309DRAFT_949184 [Dichomitus squalens]|uniref:Cytochrome b561 domain-containing protein n=1 Tax=Dichomitus squalens TaxID=114155 RepID=A0A4Q9MD05_9APHY|nr:uncharacterized protein DICSQDRAFT_124480 [Dichomitus squalens LYAD-421 SS1]EJF65227.1 hypothetical protein DICSQDRAFT_124480 [Dichomitus squalens LYAD-421 SS1]TBU25165.1 hypothetical protein BD311DRAFT_670306 [Dichomitus squalens]TBU48632.1 hypothetical protein BD309DRAFT_949184 [Dichomitus squalens]TBU59692.1 hypothetical protein BD310DRAFT_924431 [Dichomitus squalens]
MALDIVIPLLPFEKYIIAHAILCVIGFLGLLPLGALVARYTRTFSPSWFTAHWIIQFALAGPVIIVGVSMGIHAVVLAESGPINDVHKQWGIAIFVLYLAQLAFGASIHYFKPKAWARGTGRRPFQNYFHAVTGLLLIAFAMYQVRTGFRTEWPLQTGRGPISNGANVFWYVWIVLLPVVYFAGVIFLIRRQFALERQARMGDTGSTEPNEPMAHQVEPSTATSTGKAQ